LEQEERLRQSESLLRSLVDGAKDFAILKLDEQGRVASWNRGAEQILGYTHDEVVGRGLDHLRPPDDRSVSEKQLLIMAERQGRAEVEGWRLHKSGRRLWTNSVLTPLRDDRGRLTGFVRVLRDFSDRRRVEEALAERSRLCSLQADIGAALTRRGGEAQLLHACASTIALHLQVLSVRIWTIADDGAALRLGGVAGGLRKPYRLGQQVPLSAAVTSARTARVGKVRTERLSTAQAKRRSGARGDDQDTLSTGQPMVLEGRVVGVLEIDHEGPLDNASLQTLETLARSIALGIERLSAEERLARTLEELEQILLTVPEAVFTLDEEGRLVKWNQKLEQVTGLSSDQLKSRRLVDLIEESERARAEKGLDQARRTGASEWEAHVRRADGSLAPISWVLALRQGADKIPGWTGSGRDVSETRETEMRLAELSRSLLHLREEEQRKISRELHDSTAQTLAAVCMNLAGLRDGKAGLDAASARAVAEAAELAERSLSEVRTISYLLHPPLLDEVGLPAALRWFIKGFSRRSGLDVKLDLQADFKRLHPELELAIFRIVQESLSNVHRHAKARKARVSLRRKKNDLRLEIEDDGGGVTALTGARAGRKSRSDRPARAGAGKPRSDRARTQIDWMGLGLIGIRERVSERRGHLEIVTGNRGTTVRVELPMEGRAAS
jgi:PAS domain S-box-containing protein